MSIELSLKADYASVRSRLWAKRKVPAPVVLPSPVDVAIKEEPKIKAIEGTAKAYLIKRCEELDLTLNEIISHRRNREIVKHRTMLISEVYEFFPLMSLPAIGKVFCRDHTSILAAVRRFGVHKGSDALAKVLPSQDHLRSVLSYNELTGALVWKKRNREDFASEAAYASHLVRIAEKEAGHVCIEGYRKIVIGRTPYTAHRLIWMMAYGEDVKYPEFEIDHINGIRDDNRLENLRKVTKSENQRNSAMRKTNASGVMGVNWVVSKQRWIARIWDGKHHRYLGQYVNIEDARNARLVAERALGYNAGHGKKIDRLKQTNPSILQAIDEISISLGVKA